MFRTSASMLALSLALTAGARVASADPDYEPSADVPSTASGQPILTFHIAYEYEHDRSTITRESVGDAGTDPLAPTPTHKEMAFQQDQHTVTPSAELAIYHDTWLAFSLPIIVSQTRELDVAPGNDKTMISTVTQGLLPATGLNAGDPSGFAANSNQLFKSATRYGTTQLHMGFGFAPMNQRTDDTKPTWRIGADYLLAVGKVMRFDPTDPSGETGVSSGVDEVRVWTSVDRQIERVRPWFEMFWQAPVRARSTSLFQDPGFGATNVLPGQQAGTHFGVDLTLANNPEDGNRVSLGIGGRVIAHFEGRGYSELWEVLANAGSTANNGPLVLDADPTMSGVQALSHPGIDDIENYLETGVRVALRGELGKRVRFAATGDLTFRTDHVITFANAGIDLPTCTATQTTGCEIDNNNVVNPGTAEVNPAYNQKIDLVGHRYHSEDFLGVILGIETQILF